MWAPTAVSFAGGCGSKKEDAGKHADEKAGEHKDESLVKLSDAEAAQAGVKTEALAEQTPSVDAEFGPN